MKPTNLMPAEPAASCCSVHEELNNRGPVFFQHFEIPVFGVFPAVSRNARRVGMASMGGQVPHSAEVPQSTGGLSTPPKEELPLPPPSKAIEVVRTGQGAGTKSIEDCVVRTGQGAGTKSIEELIGWNAELTQQYCQLMADVSTYIRQIQASRPGLLENLPFQPIWMDPVPVNEPTAENLRKSISDLSVWVARGRAQVDWLRRNSMPWGNLPLCVEPPSPSTASAASFRLSSLLTAQYSRYAETGIGLERGCKWLVLNTVGPLFGDLAAPGRPGQETILREILEQARKPVRRSPIMSPSGSHLRLRLRASPKASDEDLDTESPGPRPVVAVGSASSDNKILRTYTDEDLDRQVASRTYHEQLAEQVAIGFQKMQMHTDSCIKRIAQHDAFEFFFAMVVVSNAVFIGVDVQHTISHPGPRPLSYRVTQYIYTALFLFELMIRVGAQKWKYCSAEDWQWKCLDVFVVLTSLWEVAVDVITAIFEGQQSIEAIQGLRNLKSFRIIRLTRLLRAVQFVRIFRFVMALRMLVDSIFSTLKSLFWALIRLCLVIYVFAVMFADAVNDYNNDTLVEQLSAKDFEATQLYWASLPDSMLTLFMSITGGVSWVEVLRPLQAISIFWSYCFLFFVSFTYFAVLNVLTAVFCQTAIESAQNDQATMVQTMLDSKEAILDKLKALFYEIDVEEDAGKKHAGSLTVTMFEEKMRNPDVHNFFESLGLDVWDAWSFFKLLDADGGGAVDTDEFFQGCLRFRGPARSMDVGKLIQDQKWMIHNQGKFQEYVQDELAQVKEKLWLLCDSFSAEGDEEPFSKES
eukprot:s3983_g2.t3